MKLSYSLTEEDYLNFQLYYTLHSPYNQRVQTRTWILVPLIYVIFAAIGFILKLLFLFVAFLALAILWIIFYPSWIKRRYVKMLKGSNNDIFKNRFGKSVEIAFTRDYVTIKDYAGEAKIKLKEIESINEIRKYYYLRFSTGVVFIIPKEKLLSLKKVEDYLKNLAEKFQIKYHDDSKWEWK